MEHTPATVAFSTPTTWCNTAVDRSDILVGSSRGDAAEHPGSSAI
jgi:hypothetical protein